MTIRRLFGFVCVLSLAVGCSPEHVTQNGSGSDLGSEQPTLDADNSLKAFETSLHLFVSSNCVACHGVFQDPMFAVDNLEQSHSTIINNGLVDFAAPESSRLVLKIAGGHQNFNTALADEIEQAIINWANGR